MDTLNFDINSDVLFINTIDSGTRRENEDTVELLCEQVETFKQQLQYKQLELQEIEQELSYVNKELCAALTSEWLTLDEAKELAKKILVSKKTVRESVAELLSAIYHLTVETSELGHIDTPNSITLLKNALDNRSLAEFKILKSMMAIERASY